MATAEQGLDMEALEGMVDRHTLYGVLAMLLEICGEKASHLEANWQDRNSAKVWDKAAKELDRVQGRLFGGTVRSALVHAVTQYDVRQARGKRYNVYALAQYLGRVDDICQDIAAGASTPCCAPARPGTGFAKPGPTTRRATWLARSSPLRVRSVTPYACRMRRARHVDLGSDDTRKYRVPQALARSLWPSRWLARMPAGLHAGR